MSFFLGAFLPDGALPLLNLGLAATRFALIFGGVPKLSA